MFFIAKAPKEVWLSESFRVREATKARKATARKNADKRGADLTAMIYAAINRVYDELEATSSSRSPDKSSHNGAATQLD